MNIKKFPRHKNSTHALMLLAVTTHPTRNLIHTRINILSHFFLLPSSGIKHKKTLSARQKTYTHLNSNTHDVHKVTTRQTHEIYLTNENK